MLWPVGSTRFPRDCSVKVTLSGFLAKNTFLSEPLRAAENFTNALVNLFFFSEFVEST